MKLKTKYLVIFLIGSCLSYTACSTFPLEKKSSVDTRGTTNTEYTVNATLSKGIDAAKTVSDSIVPSPYNTAIDLALGGLSIGLAWFAKFKNQQANDHKNAADILAATVVKNNIAGDALKVASGTESLQTVAQHIDNNTV